MNRSTAVRAAGVLVGVLLLALLLAPVLWWDPTAVLSKGGDGWAALDEWSHLSRSDKNPERRAELEATFKTVRSHLGNSWFARADADGKCWALALEPVDVQPHLAGSPSWCADGSTGG